MSTFDNFDEFAAEPYEDPFTEFVVEGYDDGLPVAGRHARRDIEDDLREAIALVQGAKSMPMSASALIPREDLLAILDDALRNVPEEIREARRALREREELMYEEQRKAANLMEQVKVEAARMVEKTEIVRQSRLRAEQIITEAQSEGRKIINQSEDFIDQKLAGFEIVLERLLRTTQSGRERLQSQGMPAAVHVPPPAPADATPFDHEADDTSGEGGFFDQDA